MARREEFSAGLLTVDVGIELPVYEGANFVELKSALNDLLFGGSGKQVPSSVTDTDKIKEEYEKIVYKELGNKGITVLGYVHGNRKRGAAAVTSAALVTSHGITSIRGSSGTGNSKVDYKDAVKLTSSDTATGFNNTSDIGLYLLSYYVDEYYPNNTSPPGRWEAAKYVPAPA